LQKLDAVMDAAGILASNTSYIDINLLAASTQRPDRFLGLHFFSPAHVMRLLEVVRGAATSPQTLARALALGKQLNKLAVVVGVCEGFVGNRILSRFWDACTFMVEDGTPPQEIDAAFERFGMAMGPFAVQDLAGLDISYAMRQRLAAQRQPHERVPVLVDRLVEQGRLGQKSGQGWYRYEAGKRQVDPVVSDLVTVHAGEAGRLSGEAIIARGRAAMVNEAAKILQEGIVPRASDIDLVKINGYGFPVWRGGVMFEAMQFGLEAVLAEAHKIAQDYGPTWEVSDALIEAVRTQKGFA
jgi:3-hydroxyacyl-CoA dehydrogenase